MNGSLETTTLYLVLPINGFRAEVHWKESSAKGAELELISLACISLLDLFFLLIPDGLLY